ncbi:MAG: hypothetical protein K0V04_44725, partial [Deltaproteobacteria bacterium]|nr:hypothetical protein [Deltaproteobacteria bacterium]
MAIDIDPQLPNAEVTRGWVLERTHDVVGGLGAPIEPGALIQVVLGGASRDYRISVVLLQDGVALSDSLQPAPVVCECGSDEMLDRIAGAIEDGAKTLADVAARERAAEAAALADARQQAERKRIEDEEKEKQRAAARQAALEQAPYRPTRLGWAGVGALALGGAMSITGTVMLTRQGAVGSRASYLHVERNWVPPGGALLGTGLVAVVVGTSLLVVDAVRCRRDPARCVHEDD